MDPGSNIEWQPSPVTPEQRRSVLGQRGCVVWLTGLSGSGKSTIASGLERVLVEAGNAAFVLDGDNLRHGLCRDLGFSPEERQENVRRTACAAELLASAGIIAIAALISPYREDREAARDTVGADRFFEVFVDTPLETCERRDPKGLYRRARTGEIAFFTGVSAPYEPPTTPCATLQPATQPLVQCVDVLRRLLADRGVFSS